MFLSLICIGIISNSRSPTDFLAENVNLSIVPHLEPKLTKYFLTLTTICSLLLTTSYCRPHIFLSSFSSKHFYPTLKFLISSPAPLLPIPQILLQCSNCNKSVYNLHPIWNIPTVVTVVSHVCSICHVFNTSSPGREQQQD